MEKWEFSLVKAKKLYRPYILSSKVVIYIPNTMVKDILLEMEVSRKIYRWVNKLQEYDMDIQTTKLVRGFGLDKLMAKRNMQTIEVNKLEEERVGVFERLMSSEWYKDAIFYLIHLYFHEHLSKNQKRDLKLTSQKYLIINYGLAWKNPEGVLLKYIMEDEAPKTIVDLHGGVCGGNFAARVIKHKIMRACYWWPTLIKDKTLLVRICEHVVFSVDVESQHPRISAA